MIDNRPIDWNDSLQTGIDEVDKQHKILVNALSEVETRVTGSSNRRLLDRVTRDLLAFAIYHFETEERLMKQHGYDTEEPENAGEHVRQHRAFTERIITLRAEVLAGQSAAQEALVSFLKDWLTNHIRTTDQRLGRFIRTKLPENRRR